MKRTILLTIALILSIIAFNQTSYASSVTIDAINGTWDDMGTIKTCPMLDLSFDIRYTNTTGLDIEGITSGFRFWTLGGSSFSPITIDTLYLGFENYFDVVYNVAIFSDGIGADTIGFGGAATDSIGLAIGFDEVLYRIKIDGLQEGETICIDSSFYPPSGQWKWAEGNNEYYPDWAGPICIQSVTPSCLGPLGFTNYVDTIYNNCEDLSYTYDVYGPFENSYFNYYIIDGPGTMNTNTGEWSFDFQPEDFGTIQNLIIGAYELCKCNYIACTTSVKISTINPIIDITEDCSSDISDLLRLVSYMFKDGIPPVPFLAADMNKDDEIDIADLIWMINYMFKGGPPPIG